MATPERKTAANELFDFSDRIEGTAPEFKSIERAKMVLTDSKSFWPQVMREPGGFKNVFVPYTLVVCLGPIVVGSVLSTLLVSVFSMFFGAGMIHMGQVVYMSLMEYLYTVVGLVVSAKLVEFVAPNFNLRKSFVLSSRVVVYASTPMFLTPLVSWIPFLGLFAQMAGFLWCLQLFIEGCRVVLKEEKPVPAPVVAEEPAGELVLR